MIASSRPVRSRPTIAAMLFGLVFGAFGVFAAGVPAGPLSYPVGVAIGQMEDTQHGSKRKVSRVWGEDLGEKDVARGAADPMETAYWEVTLRALGDKAVFRLKP